MDTERDRIYSMARFAIHLLDTQDGIDLDTYERLKEALKNQNAYQCDEILDNVEIHGGRAFLSEIWVEENYERYEN